MATRNIKDAKDLSTNELIYFKSHAKATYMSDGTTVEDAINNIQAGGGISASTAYPVVNHGTNNTTFTLTPNTLHIWGMIDYLDLSLGEEVEGVVNEYFFQFESKRYTSLLLPDNVLWNVEPTINIWNTYQVSIVNGLAVICEFEKPRFVFRVLFGDSWHEYNCVEGITWDEWIRSAYNVDGFFYSQGSIVTSNGYSIATNDSGPVKDYHIIEPVDYILL